MLRPFEGKTERASILQVVVRDVCPFSFPMCHVISPIILATDDDHHDRSRDARERERGRGHGRRDHRDRRANANANDDRRSGYSNVPTGPRAERAKAAATSSAPSPGPQSVPASNRSTPGPDAIFTPAMTDEDLAALRSRYLGVDKKKRKIRKMNERKFVFDWDEQEDTFSADPSANIGVQRQGAQVMFGRGHIAGMDDGGGSRTGTKSDTQLADAKERRKAAKHGYDDRHWTDKALDEMKERDWRIFREDFSIAARGLYISKFGFYRPVTPA
jgi:ATP-dependent RNA helicase DDX23/PRP28